MFRRSMLVFRPRFDLIKRFKGNGDETLPDHTCANSICTLSLLLSQAYVTFFRLRGPFIHPNAVKVSETELLQQVRRRPVLVNLAFAVVILLFMVVNVLAAALSSFLSVSSYALSPLFSSFRTSLLSSPPRNSCCQSERLREPLQKAEKE